MALYKYGAAGLGLMLAALAVCTPLGAQGKPKDLIWTHAFDLSARKYGEADFGKDTQKFGVEAFKDNNNNLGLYLSQIGGIGVGPGFEGLSGAIKDSKGPEWLTGLDLPARKAGEKEF